jgi:4-amino-4-deoxy-L-arabinose transferase-like glycosyltransferase
VLLALILCLGAVARVLSFHGYAGSDDGSYAELAQALAAGKFRVGAFTGPPVFPLRVGVFAPVALLFQVFGPSETAVLAYPFLLSLAAVVLAYVAGRLFFGTTGGLIAAALQAIVPLASRSATILMPDLPAAFWANAGILLFYVGSRRGQPREKLLYGALGGMMLGCSWLCKESAAYLAPLFLIAGCYLVRRSRSNWALLAGLAAASGAFLLGEALVYRALTGDALFRFHETHRNYDYSRSWFFTEGSRFGWEPGQYHLALCKRLFRDGPVTLLASPSFGGVTAIGLLAVFYALFHHRRAFLFPGLWFMSLLLVFNFGSANLTQYQPLVLFDKYAYPLLLPACLLSAGLLTTLLAGARRGFGHAAAERRFWVLIIAAGLCGACCICTGENILSGRKSEPERLAAARLSPSDRLYTDRRTLRVLEFFWSFPKQAYGHDFQGLTAHDIPDGSYVLINRDKLRFLSNNYGYAIPSFCSETPLGWTVVSKTRGAVLYRTPGGRQAQMSSPPPSKASSP